MIGSTIFSIKTKRKSILYHLAELFMNAEERVDLVCSSATEGLEKRMSNKYFQFITLLKTLNLNDPLFVNFFGTYAANYEFFESQLGQDCFVDTLLNGKRNGIFIEIGVGNGIQLSNTYFLEKKRDWTGLLCEPSKKFHQSILDTRDATLIPSAVLKSSQSEVDFVEVQGATELSTVKEYMSTDKHNREKALHYPVNAISFNDLCKKYLPGNQIDYLSIDTEGSEFDIISSIDLDEYTISIISVEHNYNREKLAAIRAILVKKGYVEMTVFSWDSIFVKREMLTEYYDHFSPEGHEGKEAR